jgi:hypothetical protein
VNRWLALYKGLVASNHELNRRQMPQSEKTFTPRKHRLSPSARRALEMLANDFATESILRDHGFTSSLLTGLVTAGLAMLYRAPLKVGSRRVEVTYMMITAAGRRALKVATPDRQGSHDCLADTAGTAK